jgi:hypothetical protein
MGVCIFSLSSYATEFYCKCESQYFTIYCEEGVNPLEVAYKIDINKVKKISENKRNTLEPEEVLSNQVDLLFEEVSDILDMHLYSYHGKLKIYLNQESLERVFRKLLGKELKFKSFYYHDENTIYISAEDIRPGILAHEIAHAIINHYFIVPPPMKVQEVLAGFVEYCINKKMCSPHP